MLFFHFFVWQNLFAKKKKIQINAKNKCQRRGGSIWKNWKSIWFHLEIDLNFMNLLKSNNTRQFSWTNKNFMVSQKQIVFFIIKFFHKTQKNPNKVYSQKIQFRIWTYNTPNNDVCNQNELCFLIEWRTQNMYRHINV